MNKLVSFGDVLEQAIEYITYAELPDNIIRDFRNDGYKEHPYKALSNDPLIQKGYLFEISTDVGTNTLFEVINFNDELMQIGIKTFFGNLFSLKSFSHFNHLEKTLSMLFPERKQIAASGVTTINFYDSNILCYISRIKTNWKPVVVFNATNRKIWDKYK